MVLSLFKACSKSSHFRNSHFYCLITAFQFFMILTITLWGSTEKFMAERAFEFRSSNSSSNADLCTFYDFAWD